MEIKRDRYLEKIISYMWDGQVKVITGIRRCGKSYLLGTLFRKYLLENGTKPENIFSYAFDLAFSGKNRVQFGIPYPYTLHLVIIQRRVAVYRQTVCR